MQQPRIGDPYRFVPSGFEGETAKPGAEWKKSLPRAVTGRIVYINKPHRFFVVAYEANGVVLKESFKF